MSRRGIAFAALTVACLIVAGGSVLWAAAHSTPPTSDAVVVPVRDEAPSRPATEPREARKSTRVAAAPRGGLMVRAVDRDDPRLNGAVTEVGLDGAAAPRPSGTQACQRVYYAGGRGICLLLAGRGVSYRARIFDSRMRTLYEVPMAGIPSRARVSPGARYGSYTSFVNGHSYAASGAFSTETIIVDMRSADTVANLEDFEVVRDGKAIDAPDFNFWGVTFDGDGGRFFATLATGPHYYLVRGDVATRRMTVLADGIECPSLSPDGTRIAYKSRIGNDRWRVGVIELDGMRRTLLGESRSVDDQPEWLDGGWVAYGLGNDVWAARSDGRGRARRLLANATSPVALR